MELFKGKKVLIMGLGLHGGGVGVAKFFVKQGADVLVTDLKTKEQLQESLKKLKGLKIKYTLGGHREEDFINSELIVKNPDVPASSPYLEIARKNKVPVETDITLFFKLSGAFIIGVTGTKGKSTTASLIYHLLKTKYKTFLAGNIGISPLELLARIKPKDKVVLELSSFGLEDLKQSPSIAVITNIMPDHLNRYATMTDYVETKKRIFKFQKKSDCLVANGDDSIVRQMVKEAPGKICWFYPKKVSASGFSLLGEHNKANLAATIAVAKILKISDAEIKKAIKTFKGVHGRQEFVKEARGVKYFNDTTATIPEAVVAAIDSFSIQFPKSKLFLICGGVYKGVDYKEFAKKVKEKSVGLIMLPGSGSDKMKESLFGYRNMTNVGSMREAVKTAGELAKEGDVVILSPGASSFNMFKNEFDRGDQFVRAVKSL